MGVSVQSHAPAALYLRECFPGGEPDSSVSIVSGYGLDARAIEVRSLTEAIEVRSLAEAIGFFL
jgi:hypothetical protein